MAITCVSIAQAQSVYFNDRIPHNQKEHFEIIKTGILEEIANDKAYNSDKERIRYAETMAFSKIMNNAYYIDENGKKIKMKHSNNRKLKKAMEHMLLFTVRAAS